MEGVAVAIQLFPQSTIYFAPLRLDPYANYPQVVERGMTILCKICLILNNLFLKKHEKATYTWFSNA